MLVVGNYWKKKYTLKWLVEGGGNNTVAGPHERKTKTQYSMSALWKKSIFDVRPIWQWISIILILESLIKETLLPNFPIIDFLSYQTTQFPPSNLILSSRLEKIIDSRTLFNLVIC